MKRTIIITGIVVVLAIIVLIIFNKATSKKDSANLYVEAIKGQFDIVVTTTGEFRQKIQRIYGDLNFPKQETSG